MEQEVKVVGCTNFLNRGSTNSNKALWKLGVGMIVIGEQNLFLLKRVRRSLLKLVHKTRVI